MTMTKGCKIQPLPGKVEEGQCMPEKPNVYSDGSVKNPRGLRWKAGGVGIWWQNRDMGKRPLTEAEELYTHQQTCGVATSLWTCFKDTQNSSTRCELGAAIFGVTPPDPCPRRHRQSARWATRWFLKERFLLNHFPWRCFWTRFSPTLESVRGHF